MKHFDRNDDLLRHDEIVDGDGDGGGGTGKQMMGWVIQFRIIFCSPCIIQSARHVIRLTYLHEKVIRPLADPLVVDAQG